MPEVPVSRELAFVLDALTDDQRREVLDYAREVASTGPAETAPGGPLRRGTPLADLMHLAGTIGVDDAAEMLREIEQGCGRVEPDAWD